MPQQVLHSRVASTATYVGAEVEVISWQMSPHMKFSVVGVVKPWQHPVKRHERARGGFKCTRVTCLLGASY